MFYQFPDLFDGYLVVPQGVPSIIGPLFFILYVNDLVAVEPHYILFADDLNESLKTISDWFEAYSLKLNLQKSNYIRFGVYDTVTNSLPLPDLGTIQLSGEVKFLALL